MAALIPDKRCVALVSFIFFLQIKTQHALSGTSAATYKVMEPHRNESKGPIEIEIIIFLFESD